jgi:hypothetical protein
VVFAALVAFTTVALGPAGAQAGANLGMTFAAPPRLVRGPGSPVMYAPAAPANYFRYGRRYYVFSNNVWYTSRGFYGPWAVVPPAYVPRPLLAVPVRYYRRPPRGWRRSQRGAPPHWGPRWGRRWRPR